MEQPLMDYGKNFNENGFEVVRRFKPLSELPPPPVPEWLADGYIPLGGLTVLVAEEGIGKTTLANLLHALVTSGQAFPPLGIEAGEGEGTAALYFEDSRGKVHNSVAAMGGNLDRMLQLQATEDDPDSLTGAATVDDLKLLAGQGVRLLTVDPVSEMIGSGVNMGVATEARRALAPFTKFARDEDCAVLLIGHTNRQATANLRDRAGLSAQLRMIARSFLVALRYDTDEHGPGFLVGVNKSNLVSPLPNALHFKTVITTTTRVDSQGRFESVGTVELVRETDRTIADWATELFEEANADKGATGDCVEWLKDQFGSGLWIDQKTTTAAAQGLFSASQLRSARTKLGIERKKGTLRPVGQGEFQHTWWGLEPMDDDMFGRYMLATDHGRKPENWQKPTVSSEDVA